MASVLSTTEVELIGFQSQLCRVSRQSTCPPRTLRPCPEVRVFLSSRRPPVNGASKRLDLGIHRDAVQGLFSRTSICEFSTSRNCRCFVLSRGSRLNSGRTESSRVPVKGETGGFLTGTRLEDYRGITGSDRWKDKQTSRNERVRIALESSPGCTAVLIVAEAPLPSPPWDRYIKSARSVRNRDSLRLDPPGSYVRTFLSCTEFTWLADGTRPFQITVAPLSPDKLRLSRGRARVHKGRLM